MTENFLFKALFISLTVHTTFLCVAYFSKVTDPHLKATQQKQIEISYRPPHKKSFDIHEYPIKPAQHLDLSNAQKLFSGEGSIPVSLAKDNQSLPFGMSFERKSEPQRMMQVSRKVFITPIKSEKINNPVYAAYQEMVHSRILEKANEIYFKKVDQSSNKEIGVVYLTFLINEKGELVGAQIIPEKTNASGHLQEIAMESLQSSSPFPPFLKGMNLSEYPLSIEIDYQVSN